MANTGSVIVSQEYKAVSQQNFCQTADLTADLNLYFVLKGHVPPNLFAMADHM